MRTAWARWIVLQCRWNCSAEMSGRRGRNENALTCDIGGLLDGIDRDAAGSLLIEGRR